MSLLRRTVRCLTAVLVSLPIAAQERVIKHGDPYLPDVAEHLERAGYVGHGPSPIGRFFGTADVNEVLDPSHRLSWLETPHFVVGARLPVYLLSDGDTKQREKLREELARLRERLPDVERDVRSLDPWLRTHLFAQRCEATYRQILELLSLRDDAFPERASVRVGGEEFRGIGPHLGMRGKFVLLVFASREDLARFSVQFFGESWAVPTTRDLGHGLGFLIACAIDDSIGLTDDTELHVRVVDGLVRAACQGLCAPLFDVPAWCRTGLALDFVRRVDPEHPGFDRVTGRVLTERARIDWVEHARGLARRGSGRPLADLALVREESTFGFNDSVALWSKVAWLRASRRAEFARFLLAMKQPIWPGAGTLDYGQVLERQFKTIQECFGTETMAALDEQWRRAVLAGG